ncbi:MAG: lasso peptide biosynthesis B2 protein [Butyrivibrio sp.]|nr:lasso peptide biosynthesis B2 protein [Butyrivibrio sp.]
MSVSLYRFIKLNKFKKMTLAIWWLTAFYRMQMLIVPSKKLEHRWGQKGVESPEKDTMEHYRYAYVVSMEVNRIADKTPWESKCLVRALTARFLLHRKGIETTLYLGVGKDEKGKMIAHSWIRCGEMYVTGGNGKSYATVARFCM